MQSWSWVFVLLLGTFPAWAQLDNDDDDDEDDTGNYKLLMTDSLPKTNLTIKTEEIKTVENKNRKKDGLVKNNNLRGKYYLGIKTKKGFAKKGAEITQTFRYVVDTRIPENKFSQDIYYYDVKKRLIKNLPYEKYMSDLDKGRSYLLLHGPFKEYYNKEVREEGYFYYGTKHELWETFDKDYNLLEKLKYYKGWVRGSEINYYSEENIRDITTIVGGEKHGDYFSFYDNGKIAIEGKYEYGKKVGLWTEFHKNGRKKRTVQYPKLFYLKDLPYVSYEWDAQGNVTYNAERDGKKYVED